MRRLTWGRGGIMTGLRGQYKALAAVKCWIVVFGLIMFLFRPS